jgi:hypothetical protein
MAMVVFLQIACIHLYRLPPVASLARHLMPHAEAWGRYGSLMQHFSLYSPSATAPLALLLPRREKALRPWTHPDAGDIIGTTFLLETGVGS